MTSHKRMTTKFRSFSFGFCIINAFDPFWIIHLILRLVLEIFDISTLRISHWLFQHHTFQKQKLLSLFPSQILVCATGFCSLISLLIWRFTFSELYLQKHKNKSGKIYRHKSMQVSRQTRLLTKLEDLFTTTTYSFQDIFHPDKCAYRYKLSS